MMTTGKMDSNFPPLTSDNAQIMELLRRRAKERGMSAKGNTNTLILAYTTLAITIILALREMSIVIVSLVAVLGLVLIWAFGKLQMKKMEQQFLKDELRAFASLLETKPQPIVHEDTLSAVPESDSPLTDRELQVLKLIAEGKSNKEAAIILHISDQTVKNHISHIFSKLGVSDRTSAVLMAISHGWVKTASREELKPMLDKDL